MCKRYKDKKISIKQALKESRESVKKYKKKWDDYRTREAELFEYFWCEKNG
jgi:hypothetical protein